MNRLVCPHCGAAIARVHLLSFKRGDIYSCGLCEGKSRLVRPFGQMLLVFFLAVTLNVWFSSLLSTVEYKALSVIPAFVIGIGLDMLLIVTTTTPRKILRGTGTADGERL
jgi:hypothetical protein